MAVGGARAPPSTGWRAKLAPEARSELSAATSVAVVFADSEPFPVAGRRIWSGPFLRGILGAFSRKHIFRAPKEVYSLPGAGTKPLVFFDRFLWELLPSQWPHADDELRLLILEALERDRKQFAQLRERHGDEAPSLFVTT